MQTNLITMNIHVCSLFELPAHAQALRPGYLVSIIQPEFQPDTPPEIDARNHYRLAVHDIAVPTPGSIHTKEEHIYELVRFLRCWATTNETLLIHCFAGISRSTAVALVALLLKTGSSELDAALTLRAAAPHAKPNRLIISLADSILGCEGRLIAARNAMGVGELAHEGPLVTLEIP